MYAYDIKWHWLKANIACKLDLKVTAEEKKCHIDLYQNVGVNNNNVDI